VRKFGSRKPPAKQTIANVVKKLETTGSVMDIHAGGKRPMLDETVVDVKQRSEHADFLRRQICLIQPVRERQRRQS
jgi:hypothetical protein